MEGHSARAFVNERLTAAAEEIFHVFERTITKYEEDASSSKQEIERLGGLLQEFVSNHNTDFSQSSTCKEETSPEQLHCEREPSASVHQRDPDTPQHIKEEAHELWAIQQPEEEQEFKEADVSCLPPSSAWVKNEQDDTHLPVHPRTQTRESEEQFQVEIETVHFVLPLASPLSSQTPIHNEMIQDGRENERTAASFTSNQTQIDRSQSAIIASRESPHLSHLSSVAPDYRCYLCDKSFSSNHHLTNHAFRIHSKDAEVLCAVCGTTLESTESLNVHLNSHKGSKCCHMCGKQCKSNTALTEHMAGHSGVKLHRCHVCGKECSRKGDLKIHMRIHTGEKPFCCSYCDKSFTHSGHLRKHLRSHTGERPHRCVVCGRGFLQSTHLKYHLRTHAP
ncbi:zinc finger protein 91-like isoform X2 [Cyclopterus lumpus]|uniref:zinc finger protein 91-like isoform X2 n=1 Tax=Cyclopterus lumpus TaxID=8103 RepID=UPI0014871A5B|nr:zinc finger protein 91-like isoform X2 [Cyclopterus lumpus]XP_034407699.1 zinc finger protein 91-like isoform X2 [Cyclopterus lumpus]